MFYFLFLYVSVPFDIGVVYIIFLVIVHYVIVLVPFDIGVVYIPSLFWVTGYLFITFSLSIYVFGTFVLIYFFLVKWYRPPYLYYTTFFDFSKFQYFILWNFFSHCHFSCKYLHFLKLVFCQDDGTDWGIFWSEHW